VAAVAVLPAASAGEPAVPAGLCGRLGDCGGVPVLEVWGTPEQEARAHGYLMAERILDLFDGYVLDESMLASPVLYESILVPGVRRQFEWPAEREKELRALLAGMQERLGADAVRSKKLNRALRVEDLMIANALADWFGSLCSTVSVWGALTPDGQTITARNLDYPSAGGMAAGQVIMIYRGDGHCRPWAGVGWPGLVGVYTGMNDGGVTIAMHDATGRPPAQTEGFTPRSLILREALEAASPESFVADVRAVFRRRHVMVGNNIHVSAPRRGREPAAVVFEYDANAFEDGVTVRRATDNPTPLADAIWCTNHMRLRKEPVKSRRFARVQKRLANLAGEKETLDVDEAMKLIHSIRQKTTVHSVVFEPATRVMHVHIPAAREQAVTLRLAEWLARPVGGSAAPPAARAEDKP
jgi:hypothetical protein